MLYKLESLWAKEFLARYLFQEKFQLTYAKVTTKPLAVVL